MLEDKRTPYQRCLFTVTNDPYDPTAPAKGLAVIRISFVIVICLVVYLASK